MAEETQKTAAAPATVEEVVAVSDVPVAEKPATTTLEKELLAAPEPETEEKPAAEEAEAPKEEVATVDEKITESASFKEETNVAGELPDPQKKALDELKLLVQEALNKHEFTPPPPPPPPPAVDEEKPAAAAADEKAEEPKPEEPKPEEPKLEVTAAAEPPPAVAPVEPPKPESEVTAPPVETKEEEKSAPPPPPPAAEPTVPAAVVEKVASVDEDGAKTVEAIKETIVEVSSSTSAPPPPPPEEAPAPPAEESAAPPAPAPAEEVAEPSAAAEVPPPPPQEVSIWGIKLLADEKSDVILLKFLRARDFKVKDAFTMIKNTVIWQKQFGIETLISEDLGSTPDLDKVVFMSGTDQEGHPVCYNVYGKFQNKELYASAFGDEEKAEKFLRWRIQFLEKSIRKLDFSPGGICSFVQVNDLKNSPGPFKRELRVTTNKALLLLQDNYPEFVAKQVFINVPWWYLAFYRMISPFFTQRTKSKFVFAGPSKSAETLFKYIAPGQVPVQYGGLSREGEQEFSTDDTVIEDIIKPTSKHTIEFPVSEKSVLVWEVRVLGWDVTYGAEFVPSTEDGYTVILQKSRKISPVDETIISNSFKVSEPGKVVLTFDNQTSKKKKLLYRSKTTAN